MRILTSIARENNEYDTHCGCTSDEAFSASAFKARKNVPEARGVAPAKEIIQLIPLSNVSFVHTHTRERVMGVRQTRDESMPDPPRLGLIPTLVCFTTISGKRTATSLATAAEETVEDGSF